MAAAYEDIIINCRRSQSSPRKSRCCCTRLFLQILQPQKTPFPFTVCAFPV